MVQKRCQPDLGNDNKSPQKQDTSPTLSSAFAKIFGECSYTSAPQTEQSLERSLRDVELQARQDPADDCFDIIDYWKKNRAHNPEIWQLIKIIYAAPASQCSVERDFSLFNALYTYSRTNLAENNLNNTLFVALNSDLIDKVPQNDTNQQHDSTQ